MLTKKQRSNSWDLTTDHGILTEVEPKRRTAEDFTTMLFKTIVRKKMTILKWIVAGLLSFWVALSPTVQLLCILIIIDYATGILHAIVEKNLSSAISFRGLVKKCLMLILVYVCHLISKPLAIGFDFGEVVALAYVVNEVISIVENCARIGVPIPPIVIDVLAKVRERDNEKAEAVHVGADDAV